MIDDKMVDTGSGVPHLGWIGGLEYKDGILDDRVSRRGIIAEYQKIMNINNQNIDVKEIAEKAKNGETQAQTVFEETGRILGKMLYSSVRAFEAECIIVGGQIAGSYNLFSAPFEKQLKSLPTLKKVTPAVNINHSALLGAGKFLFFV